MKRRGLLWSGAAVLALLLLALPLFREAAPAYVYVPFAPPENFAPPDCRLLALGTATHGNTEPVEAALELLKRLRERHGDAALLLEENVGDGAWVDAHHTFYDKERDRHVGFYRIYGGEETAELLGWLEETGVRLYGVDIQSVEVTRRLLGQAARELGFPRAEEVLPLLANAGLSQARERAARDLLDELETFLARQARKGALSEAWYDTLAHWLHTLELHDAYVAEGRQGSTRDRMMAENALWVMGHEAKYHGNEHALLLAQNGHVIKEDGDRLYNSPPMGCHLARALGEGYRVIVTEARRNAFCVQSGREFSVERTGDLTALLEQGAEDVRFLSSEELLRQGVTQWSLTMIGAEFSSALARNEAFYALPTSVATAYDAVLLFGQMTPIRRSGQI